MKEIKIPEDPVKIGQATVTFQEFLEAYIDSPVPENPFSKGFRGSMSAMKILEAADAGGASLKLEDADCRLLQECLEVGRINPAVNARCMAYHQAVREAKHLSPEAAVPPVVEPARDDGPDAISPRRHGAREP